MLKKLSFLILVSIALISPFLVLTQVSAENSESTSSDNSDEVADLEKKISKYQDKIDALHGTASTLAGELEYMNTQISITELRIQSSNAKISFTETEIKKLGNEIDDLSVRIGHLEDSISYQRDLLNNRSRERYKSLEESPIFILFGGSTLEKIIKKGEYLKLVERQDTKILDEMDRTKKSYNTQKSLFEDKKSQEETLKKQLEAEKAQLDSYKANLVDQKIEKDTLLKQTQNDEAKYQKMLQDAQAELNQIVGAVTVLKNQQSKKVKKGEVIGVQGNTGYSFGEHLHFGVYKYSSFDDIDGWNWYYSNYVNPLKKLESKSVYWNTGCEATARKSVGSGDWDWPISNPTVSQGFGHTCYSNRYYGGKDHPALDMYGSTGSYVYAADSGNAYYCRNCMGDGGNGVFIFHDDGYMSVYWHLR